MDLDRRLFIASLGGAAAVAAMDSEARAEALEEALTARVAPAPSPSGKFPTVAEVAARIPTRNYRRGVGVIFAAQALGSVYDPVPPPEKVPVLKRMPARPVFKDFIDLRFQWSLNHCLQSANHAKQAGADDELVFACLIHDHPQALFRTNHGHWGGQLYEPYVSKRVAFAVRHHAALRFFPDEKVGYSYPDLYRTMFGEDYVPPPHVVAEYEMVRKHRYYEAARAVTLHDLYAFDPNVTVAPNAFDHLIAKHFRDPREGLGYDASSSAHLWRTLADADEPL